MRRKAEVTAHEEGCFDLLWYVRHKTLPMPENTPQDIIDSANLKAADIESRVDRDYLADLITLDVEYFMLCGRIAALRWMLGMEWDDDAILDT